MLSFLRISGLLLCLVLHVIATPEQIQLKYFVRPSLLNADGNRRLYFGAKLTFANKDAWAAIDKSEGQLASIAKDAYITMSNHPEYLNKKRQATPYVMTALAVGDSIYVGSSMKGSGYLWQDYEKEKNNPMYKVLEECADELRKNGGPEAKDFHKNLASCGEIVTLLMFFKVHKNYDTAQLKGARIVTVKSTTTFREAMAPAKPDTIVVFDPCGTELSDKNPENPVDYRPLAFGCYQVLQKMGAVPIMEPKTKFVPYAIGPDPKGKQAPKRIGFTLSYPDLFEGCS